MDGFEGDFLRDHQHYSSSASSIADILYVEDFDLAPPASLLEAETASQASPVAITPADLDAARELGRAEGLRVALADAQLIQDQLQTAALQSLADALGAARGTLERSALHQASSAARILLAVLQAAVPATMAQHGLAEADAILQLLVPALVSEPVLRVRTHPSMADTVRESLSARLPGGDTTLCVSADATLAVGDVQLAWHNGQAKRDTASIWNEIRASLIPLELPSMQEICCGIRS